MHPDNRTLVSESWLREAPQNVAAKMRRRHMRLVMPPIPPELAGPREMAPVAPPVRQPLPALYEVPHQAGPATMTGLTMCLLTAIAVVR